MNLTAREAFAFIYCGTIINIKYHNNYIVIVECLIDV